MQRITRPRSVVGGLVAGAASLALALSLTSCAGSAISKDQAPEAIANSLANLTESTSFMSDDVNATIFEALKRDPRLFYFYNGYNGTYANDGTAKVTWEYKHKDTPVSKVRLMGSVDDLAAIIGEASLKGETTVAVVSSTSDLSPDGAKKALSRLRSDGSLAALGIKDVTVGDGSSDYDGALYAATVSIAYLTDVETVRDWRDRTEQRALELAGELFGRGTPDYARELAIYRWVTDNARSQADPKVADTDHSGSTAYGALVEQAADSAGMAAAFQLLCEAAGIPCQTVAGTVGGEDRSWNLVSIGGSWYWVDAATGILNATSEQLRETHAWDEDASPVATATAWNAEAVRTEGGKTADQAGESETDPAPTQQRLAERFAAARLSTLPL
ncbi:hypothetical protein HLV37_05705 [Eggerthellaceae bacterium zg-1084]|uniref:transglutaminase domain-containing protein n=1 Tax=Berryella wangjianweii TaxID=2734634 RepID=UPI0015559AC6|nr:transglutaminase domain-containing protein [Berryella wangjianweii]NPD31357.1 hypothetical protein [Berryella wangjianweii]